MNDGDHDLLIQLNVKLDHLTQQVSEQRFNTEKMHTENDLRLSKLEEWKWRWLGAMALGVFLLTLLGNFAAKGLFQI